MAPERIKTLEEVRKEYILKVLKEADWNYERASSILKVSRDYLKKEVKNLFGDEVEKGLKR